MPNRKTAEDRKAELVEVTLRLADKVGPDRLSTETIATAVGVTQAAIFRHFPKKQDLWEAVAGRIGEMFQGRWTRVERLDASGEQKLRHLGNPLLARAARRERPAARSLLRADAAVSRPRRAVHRRRPAGRGVPNGCRGE
jgi:AcrR family transcriptional regulator